MVTISQLSLALPENEKRQVSIVLYSVVVGVPRNRMQRHPLGVRPKAFDTKIGSLDKFVEDWERLQHALRAVNPRVVSCKQKSLTAQASFIDLDRR